MSDNVVVDGVADVEEREGHDKDQPSDPDNTDNLETLFLYFFLKSEAISTYNFVRPLSQNDKLD